MVDAEGDANTRNERLLLRLQLVEGGSECGLCTKSQGLREAKLGNEPSRSVDGVSKLDTIVGDSPCTMRDRVGAALLDVSADTERVAALWRLAIVLGPDLKLRRNFLILDDGADGGNGEVALHTSLAKEEQLTWCAQGLEARCNTQGRAADRSNLWNLVESSTAELLLARVEEATQRRVLDLGTATNARRGLQRVRNNLGRERRRANDPARAQSHCERLVSGNVFELCGGARRALPLHAELEVAALERINGERRAKLGKVRAQLDVDWTLLDRRRDLDGARGKLESALELRLRELRRRADGDLDLRLGVVEPDTSLRFEVRDVRGNVGEALALHSLKVR